MILCNNLPKIDDSIFYNVEVGELSDDTEVYQYYLVGADNYTIEKLKELDCNDLIISYSDMLDCYTLMVTHFGTGWDYVLTDIEPCEDLESSDI